MGTEFAFWKGKKKKKKKKLLINIVIFSIRYVDAINSNTSIDHQAGYIKTNDI